MKLAGVGALVQIGILLTISYFILLSAASTKNAALKKFAKLIVIFLCLVSALLVFLAVYFAATGVAPRI